MQMEFRNLLTREAPPFTKDYNERLVQDLVTITDTPNRCHAFWGDITAQTLNNIMRQRPGQSNYGNTRSAPRGGRCKDRVGRHMIFRCSLNRRNPHSTSSA